MEHLGLLQSPEHIINRCRGLHPELLGLTMLQFDSEEALRLIVEEVGKSTQVLAGGPPFQIDDDLAVRTGVAHVAKDVADFLDFLLNFNNFYS